MKQYKLNLSDKNSKILERLIESGEFKNPDEVLRKAINDYSILLEQAKLGKIDLFPADNGANRTQEQWIAYFNKNKEAMISAPDIYLAGQSGSDELLESLRKDFRESWIVTNTHPSYNGNDLSAVIRQNFMSNVRKQKDIYVAEVPVYEGESIKNIVEDKKGLIVVQAIFDTKDKPNKIIDTLSNLSKKAPEDIIFWTPDQNSRKSYPERAVRFGNSSDWFHVDGGNFVDGSGHSRRVK